MGVQLAAIGQVPNKRINLTRPPASVVTSDRSPRRLRAVRWADPKKGAWDLDQAKDPQAAPAPWSWWDVTDKHGVTRRYLGDDFDEFYRTSDEHDVHRHLSIGWLLLEEAVVSDAGPGHWELQQRPVSSGGGGGQRLHPVSALVPDDLSRFLLGHLRLGVTGTLVEG